MAGGTMTIIVPDYVALTQVAQRVTCWAGGVGGTANRAVRVLSGAVLGVQIGEEVFAAQGALVLKRGGANILSGYVTGSQVTFNAVNGTAVGQEPNTCPASTNQPTINSITMNVGGNPLVITLDYANFLAAGTVNIAWGDGVVTAGAAESGTPNHTYPNRGTFQLVITDASDATQFATSAVVIV